MPDPGWAARTPEDNDLLLKAGTGVATHVANQTAWTTLGASHHASGVASAINTAATSASWVGAGSAASALNVTMLNAALHGLAGWVDVKPAVVAAAIAAYEAANAGMRPAPECIANRVETATDYGINPSVLWTLTPRIASLEFEYFGNMWPTNSAVGAAYGAILAALAESLAIPPPVAGMGASPAAPAPLKPRPATVCARPTRVRKRGRRAPARRRRVARAWAISSVRSCSRCSR
ncbi:PPE family protein [Mycobacterium bohemicum DSM 44277]|uniref:PPE family protein n=1 Tax=Mycobacterium bohemicum DSM 44277 TaxID=1236609 RepID=A0A0U0W798_MYCBE|nr:PPE family protein [Mycobacterium bohemicum DSM 44277]